ncbi:hypothetical protein [Shewanella glacialipiscicola]|uniref:hypothetical protein n=1 Tax=Shewanella glacialipiscicola TaxID=614069 RepID=UPI003D797A18
MSKGIHLTEYHEAVRLWLKSNAPWLKSVEYYPELTAPLITPCAFFSVNGWDPVDNQPGNGQLQVLLHCEVLAVIGLKEKTHQLDARNAAMFLSVILQNTNFDLKVTPANVVSADADATEPDLDAYTVWSVKFVQKATIGMPTLEADEERGIRLAINPIDINDPAEYDSLESFNETTT